MECLSAPYFCETEEKKSRFLSFLMPYDDYKTELDRLRQLHPKANHHVSAFRYFDDDKRLHEGAKDDGEPSGCAGVPALKVLQGENLVNVAVIIVRYFGGIKLGTGGMARAYGAAAKAALEGAKTIPFTHQATATLSARFDRVNELERLLSQTVILDRHYDESGITVEISGPEEDIDILIQQWDRLNY